MRSSRELELENETLRQQLAAYKGALISSAVKQARQQAGVHEAAAPDVAEFAGRVLDVDESGRVFTRDSVGVTPGLDPLGLLQEVKPRKPHWFGEQKAAAATVNGGQVRIPAENPFTARHWNVTAQGALAAEQGVEVAQAAAKAAGVALGATRPATV